MLRYLMQFLGIKLELVKCKASALTSLALESLFLRDLADSGL